MFCSSIKSIERITECVFEQRKPVVFAFLHGEAQKKFCEEEETERKSGVAISTYDFPLIVFVRISVRSMNHPVI
jgi:hypothetical protein